MLQLLHETLSFLVLFRFIYIYFSFVSIFSLWSYIFLSSLFTFLCSAPLFTFMFCFFAFFLLSFILSFRSLIPFPYTYSIYHTVLHSLVLAFPENIIFLFSPENIASVSVSPVGSLFTNFSLLVSTQDDLRVSATCNTVILLLTVISVRGTKP